MHYRAKQRISKDGNEVVGIVPAFLFLDEDGFDASDLIWFLEIMEAEIIKANSFDMDFFKECRNNLNNWSDITFGAPADETALMAEWLVKLDALEDINIINAHCNLEDGQAEGKQDSRDDTIPYDIWRHFLSLMVQEESTDIPDIHRKISAAFPDRALPEKKAFKKRFNREFEQILDEAQKHAQNAL